MTLMKTVMTMAVAAVTLLSADRVWVAPLRAQDRTTTLLAQARAALGGEQKLGAVKALSAEGTTRRAAGARSVESTVALLLVRPDKLRRSEESRLLGATTERISTFDGTQAWDETAGGAGLGAAHGGFGPGGAGHGGFDHGAGGGAGDHGGWDHGQDFDHGDHADVADGGGALTAEQLAASRTRRMKRELQRWTIAFFADSPQPFTDAGRADSPDGSADVLETKDEAGHPVRYFLDPASHMPLMLQYQELRTQPAAAPRNSTVAMHFSGYKKIDGVLLPYQIDMSIDGKASEAWTIDSFKLNPKVKAAEFQRPGK